jgi:hypothetical protein
MGIDGRIDNMSNKRSKDKIQKLECYCWAVTGTYHGSIIDATTEGEARRIFHRHYNGESIIHIKKKNVPAWSF